MISGHKTNNCQSITIYTKLTGRILPLRQLAENKLEQNNLSGEASSGERLAIITPTKHLTKMTRGDILNIPWGIRPNTYIPPTLPDNYSPVIKIGSPSGDRFLGWDGTSYSTTNLQITPTSDSWEMSGEVSYTFSTPNFIAEPFPTGYEFKTQTGQYAQFKIIRLDEEVDHLGRLAFYKLHLESEELKGMKLQE